MVPALISAGGCPVASGGGRGGWPCCGPACAGLLGSQCQSGPSHLTPKLALSLSSLSSWPVWIPFGWGGTWAGTLTGLLGWADWLCFPSRNTVPTYHHGHGQSVCALSPPVPDLDFLSHLHLLTTTLPSGANLYCVILLLCNIGFWVFVQTRSDSPAQPAFTSQLQPSLLAMEK